MILEEAIFARLTAVSSNSYAIAAKRVYPGYVPDGAQLPAIMFERKLDADQTLYDIDGTVDHIRATYRINCYAAQEQFLAATTLANAVGKDLDQYRDGALPGLSLINTWRNNSYSDYDGTNKRQRVTVEMEFWYREAS